ncbi:MAG: lysophospholipase [Clostridiales bacterium]|nr:lysophospholipase [Clostridiales bacterium]
MKIVFFGDSITDASRNRTTETDYSRFGYGYVMQTVGRLYEKSLADYEVYNRGISGNRIVDLYARIKSDLWNLEPDLISILIGVNDVWHEINYQNGVELDRFEKVYRTIIEETKQKLPNVKFILCEPFVLKGEATELNYERFLQVKDYAKVVKKLANEYGLYFLPLQEELDKVAQEVGESLVLKDGVHPTVQGAVVIAKQWMKLFNQIEKEI